MGSLLWIMLIAIIVAMAGTLLWTIIRIRNFSHSQHETVIDNKLWQTMIGDDALTPELKKALLKKSTEQHTGIQEEAEVQEDTEQIEDRPDNEEKEKENEKK